MRPTPVIRFALPHEGLVVKSLCTETHARIGEWVDWTQPLAMNWLIAEIDRPVGCLMINYGTPIGRMEFMQISPSLPYTYKAIVVRNLCYAAVEQLARHGSQAVVTSIATTDTTWKQVVERRGAVPFVDSTLYIKRV